MADNDEMTVVMGVGDMPPSLPEGGDGKAPRAKLTCMDDSLLQDQPGLTFTLTGEDLILGRNEVRFNKVSRKHCRFYPMGNKWGVEDMGSANGVFVNDVRVSQPVALKNGDYVRISSVPFRFSLERPDVAVDLGDVSDDDEGGGTMLLGSREAGALIDELVKADVEEQAREEKEAPAKRPVAASPAGGPTKKQSKTGLWVALLVILLAAGGGGYYFLGQSGKGEDVYKSLQTSKKKFVRANEDGSISSSQEAGTQIADLQALIGEVNQAVASYPQVPGLRPLAAQLQILLVERQLLHAMLSGNMAPLQNQLTGAKGQMEQLLQGALEGEKRDVQLADDILGLAWDVAGLKMFASRFPQPRADAEAKPGQREMRMFQQVRQSFVERKRSSRINTAVKVHYQILGRLAIEVDSQDLPRLDQWREFVN